MQQGRTLDFGAGIWGNVFTADILVHEGKGTNPGGCPLEKPWRGEDWRAHWGLPTQPPRCLDTAWCVCVRGGEQCQQGGCRG